MTQATRDDVLSGIETVFSLSRYWIGTECPGVGFEGCCLILVLDLGTYCPDPITDSYHIMLELHVFKEYDSVMYTAAQVLVCLCAAISSPYVQ